MSKCGRPVRDLLGQRFDYLLVIGFAGTIKTRSGGALWLCRCDCGSEKIISGSRLIRKDRKHSCGCRQGFPYRFSAEYRPENRGAPPETRGIPRKWKKGCWSPEYKAWRAMIGRCERPASNDFHLYGGRGIKVFEGWRNNFDAFLDHIGPKPGPGYTLDRIDPNKDYGPGNVRWATWQEQARNRRNSVTIEYQGEKKNLKEWAALLGFNYVTLYWRWKHGWQGEKLFSVPG